MIAQIHYTPINSLVLAANEISKYTLSSSQLNLCCGYEISFDDLQKPSFPHQSMLAEKWQQIKRPEDLHINHGEFIGEGGYRHIIDQLKHKKSPNRAIMSLIKQSDILGSGDKPIPSFMIMQFTKELEYLYITSYFRALETSEFLPINLEEIRFAARRVQEEIIELRTLRFVVFAFRAYYKKDSSTLERCRIDYMDKYKLGVMIEDEPMMLVSLLKETKKTSSVIECHGFEQLKSIITVDEPRNKLSKKLHTKLFVDTLGQLIEVCCHMRGVREKSSAYDSIEKEEAMRQHLIDILIQELES